jgi:acyl carrier protein
VNTLDDFMTLVRDELGLPVTAEDAGRDLDQVAGWDSMYLLSLLAALERRTGRSLSLPELLDASSLADIYALAAAS